MWKDPFPIIPHLFTHQRKDSTMSICHLCGGGGLCPFCDGSGKVEPIGARGVQLGRVALSILDRAVFPQSDDLILGWISSSQPSVRRKGVNQLIQSANLDAHEQMLVELAAGIVPEEVMMRARQYLMMGQGTRTSSGGSDGEDHQCGNHPGTPARTGGDFGDAAVPGTPGR
jgi:hypothetical protein